MGSVPSTPNQASSNDPWWPIENQNLTLNHSPLLSAMDDEEGQRNANTLVNDRGENDDEQQQQQHTSMTLNVDTVTNDEFQFNMENENENESENVMCFDESNVTSECVDQQPNESRSNSSEPLNVEQREKNREQSLEEFKEELRVKREKRQSAIADLRNEISSLRQQLADEKDINRKLINEKNITREQQQHQQQQQRERDLQQERQQKSYDTNDNEGVDVVASTHNDRDDDVDNGTPFENKGIVLQAELSEAQFSLQIANAEILTLNSELSGTRRQVTSLKDVVAVTKQMVEIREEQLVKVSHFCIYAFLPENIYSDVVN